MDAGAAARVQPLGFFALGAGGFGSTQPPVRAGYVTREVMYAILAMDSFTLPALAAA